LLNFFGIDPKVMGDIAKKMGSNDIDDSKKDQNSQEDKKPQKENELDKSKDEQKSKQTK
jgi:hypothetical protein